MRPLPGTVIPATIGGMNKTTNLDRAFEAVRKLPQEAQDAIADNLMEAVSNYQHLRLTKDQREEVRRRLSEQNPEIATEAQVRAFFKRFDGE